MRYAIVIVSMSLAMASGSALGSEYDSPYDITLDPDIAAWTTDIPGRIDTVNAHSTPGPENWYNYSDPAWNDGIGHEWGVTVPQLYSTDNPANTLANETRQVVNGGAIPTAPTGVNTYTYQRQRLLSVAKSLVGTPYQHHHNPDWNPYDNGFSSDINAPNYWNWNQVSNQPQLKTISNQTLDNPWQAEYGQGTAGIDCSNFASYIYNVALGIQMDTAIGTLGEEVVGSLTANPIIAPDGQLITPGFLNGPNYNSGAANGPNSLATLIELFQPGDLLFITGEPNQPDDITHVIIWLGSYGTLEDGTPSDVPLVISSHDNTPAIFDGDGNLPPPGVEILPFTYDDNWFYQNFSHAMRVIDPASVPEPGELALIGGLLALGVGLWRKRYTAK
ncbi:NlpC/P60 family protein [Ruficoccus sp. ZRK36]|uniref:NlpC/P60 family protein n=1 Tax=Ruficoccus sp. ZRK36 TaxID=2866311 RepID=UPI001C7332DD|nr:NlpC/P60 family protein [Ruficoccus sp. ZRK36]QYY34932.1 C40 family peptidase [Ruficoccus sp. ZRK36]